MSGMILKDVYEYIYIYRYIHIYRYVYIYRGTLQLQNHAKPAIFYHLRTDVVQKQATSFMPLADRTPAQLSPAKAVWLKTQNLCLLLSDRKKRGFQEFGKLAVLGTFAPKR